VTVALVAASALAAACVQATTGLGFALVLTPALFALLSPDAAIIMITGLGLELNLLILVGERRRPRVAWGEVGPILAAAIPGTVCGLLVLRALPKPALQIAVGLAVIAAAILRTQAPVLAAGPASPPARLALGFSAGALTTSAGVNGPPLALWLSRRGLGPSDVRDSLSATFLGLCVIAVPVLAPILPDAHIQPALVGATFACVLAGHALGRRAFGRLDPQRFEALLLTVILLAGGASVVAGLATL
jgi:uncharacterized membrane protein YfcA